MQPHSRCEAAIPPRGRRDPGAQRVLHTGAERGDARADARMVLAPVAVPAPPHLVDPPLGDPGAELRLVVDDGDAREPVDVPAGAPQPELQVDLFRVDEEALVEEADLVERLAPEEQ